MKNKIILSIAMTSAICMTDLAGAETEQEATSVERVEVHSGKCASGKCGTLKAYEASKLTTDPQDKLSYARDGKCGISGRGVAVNTNLTPTSGTCSDGVCGQ
ncbi:MAG: hypothetical protein LRY67_06705 [Gammaproteobacteria bacterium]|nr:hypothetical protein [Gammaproteobacteria bacterium]MCD8542525.1 hypothetical protein [Gammaproteobacteria bacterium]